MISGQLHQKSMRSRREDWELSNPNEFWPCSSRQSPMRLHVNFIRAKNESTQIRHEHFSARLRREIYLHRLRCLTLFLDFFNRSHVPVLLTVRSRLQGRVHDSGGRGRNDDSLHVRPSRLLLVNPRYPSHCENAPVLQRALENRIPTVPQLTGWHKACPNHAGASWLYTNVYRRSSTFGDAVCAIASTPFMAWSNAPGCQYSQFKPLIPSGQALRTLELSTTTTTSNFLPKGPGTFPSPLIGLIRVRSTRAGAGFEVPKWQDTLLRLIPLFLLVVWLAFLMGWNGVRWDVQVENPPESLKLTQLYHPGLGRAVWFFRCWHGIAGAWPDVLTWRRARTKIAKDGCCRVGWSRHIKDHTSCISSHLLIPRLRERAPRDCFLKFHYAPEHKNLLGCLNKNDINVSYFRDKRTRAWTISVA